MSAGEYHGNGFRQLQQRARDGRAHCRRGKMEKLTSTSSAKKSVEMGDVYAVDEKYATQEF